MRMDENLRYQAALDSYAVQAYLVAYQKFGKENPKSQMKMFELGKKYDKSQPLYFKNYKDLCWKKVCNHAWQYFGFAPLYLLRYLYLRVTGTFWR